MQPKLQWEVWSPALPVGCKIIESHFATVAWNLWKYENIKVLKGLIHKSKGIILPEIIPMSYPNNTPPTAATHEAM